MDLFPTFAPQISQRYWKAFQDKDAAAAGEIISRFDRPFFGVAEKFPAGLSAVWNAVLALKGIASRWCRPLGLSLSDAEVERLSALLAEMKLPGGET